MTNLTLIPYFDLQLFAEGGGTGAGGTAAAAPTGQSDAAVAQPQQGVKDRNPLATMQYGKPDGAPAAVGQVATDERTARFEELIKGEYKDLYDARIKDTVSKRLKGNEATVNKFNQLSPVLDLLAGKYGVKVDDIEGLRKAIEDDETYYEDEALEKGLTVEQVKKIRQMERENSQLKADMERAKTEEQAKQQYAALMQQAEAVKAMYPNFDLQAELGNEDMRRLITSGVPLQTAFEVVHKDEIIPAALRFTAQKSAEKVANSVRSGMTRPREAAMANTGAVQRKSDVSQLTRADREEIARRVARGEKIKF